MKKALNLLVVLGLCVGLVGCNNKKNAGSSNKTNTSESSLTFKTNGEIEEILSNKGWTGKCSVDRCYIENGITQISKDDNYSEVKNITSLSDDEINGYLDWMETKKDKGLLQDDEWASEKDKTAAKTQVSDENGIGDNEQEDEQEETVDTSLDESKLIADTKKDIMASDNGAYIKDMVVETNGYKKIKIAIVVSDSVSRDIALDIADTAIRRLSSNANIQNSYYSACSGSNYGSFYTSYSLQIGIANLSESSNRSNWLIDDTINNPYIMLK